MEPTKLVISELSPPLNYKVIKTNQDLGALEDFFSRVTEFGWDTETNITKTFFHRKARTFQFGDRNEQYIVDLLALAGSTSDLEWQGGKKAPEWAKEFVRVARIGLESASHLKIGVNLQFDYEVARWCLGMRPHNFYDCNLAEKVLHTGKVRFDSKTFWGMDHMAERYCGLIIDKTEQTKFDLVSDLTEEQIAYCALDVRLPFAIRAGQDPLIDAAGLRHVVEVIECPAIPAFGDMKIAGFGISKEKWTTQVDKVAIQVRKDVEAMDKEFIPIVGTKQEPDVTDLKLLMKSLEDLWRNEDDKALRKQHRLAYVEESKKLTVITTKWKTDSKAFQGQAAINYGSPKQVLAALNKAGIDIDSTGEDILKAVYLKKPHPVLKALRAYRTTDKLLDTYGYKFLEKYVDPDTGRIHSNINQLGADTGRTSSNKPNLQNICQDDDKTDLHYRACFVARPGYKIITRDYDGCELRIIAELSGEESWIDAFNNDQDVHSICAELVYGKEWLEGAEPGCAYYLSKQKCDCKKHKILRNSVKSVNFGVAYGAEAANLSEQLSITKEAAQVLLEKHRATFTKVHAMLNGIALSTKNTLQVRTIGCRRRLFNKPLWNRAKELCEKQFIEDEKDPKDVRTRDISRKVGSLWGSIEREGKNTPFQGTNADMAKVAFSYMWPDLEPVYGAFFVNFVHDEFVVECPEETVDQCNIFIGEMMEKAGALYIKKMRMTSGGNIADCWSK